MAQVEIINEPQGIRKGSDARGFCRVRVIDSKNGKQIDERTGPIQENERVPRKERKY